MVGARGSRAFVVVYTLSGAAGLVYEVAWTRLLTLQLGHTVAAASTVLAAFMGGLAAGAAIAGRLWSAKSPQPSPATSLRAYAALEFGVAIAALLLPFALRATVPLLAWAYADGDAPARFAFVRVAISAVLVGVPAAAMGATFPIAIAAQAGHGVSAGALYATNTTGAALGAIAAGFVLIPTLGLTGTTWVGVTLNGLAALAAVALIPAARKGETAEPAEIAEIGFTQRADHGDLREARRKRSAKKPEHSNSENKRKEALRSLRTRRFQHLPAAPNLAYAAASISGFSALVYEVVWTRLLAMVVGPTTYAFATMAASFISGLAIGSAIGAKVARRISSSGQASLWLGALLGAGAVAASAAAWYAGTALPLVVATQVADPDTNFNAIVWRQALMVALLLLPMTLALGASFPLALALAGGADATPLNASRVYAWNTAGAIAGALVAGFVLVPALGLRDSIRVAALVAAATGAAVAGWERVPRIAPARLLVPALALVAIVVIPPWDRALLASGAYKYAPYLSGTDLDGVLRAGRIVYYREGATGTVTVKDLTGTRSLAIDGKVDASNAGDMLTQRLLGFLPVALHGHAEDVAIIGLGSGVTVASAIAGGTVKRTDVLEISPEVVEASAYFDRENGRALAKPGVRLIVGDGRSHLLLSPRQYDVIVSEPSNPWMAGVASLFTREFFEAARSRLKPDGLLCQWAHTYDISTADLRSIVRTFASVFPDGSLWLVGGGDLLLIGVKEGSRRGLEARLANLAGAKGAAVLADVGVTEGAAPRALLSLFAGGRRELAQFGDGAPVQTDDRTALEYSAPRGIYGRTREDNAATIRALGGSRSELVTKTLAAATDEDWTARGLMDLRAQAFSTAYDAFREAVMKNSGNQQALSGLSDAAGGAGKLEEEREWLRQLAAREPNNAAVRIELSRVLAVTGDARSAVETAAEALELNADDPRAAEQLASVLADSGDAARLTPYADAMAKRFPDRADAQYYRASALFMSGKTEDAVTLARQLVDAHPEHGRAQGLLGAACASLGRRDCALAAFDGAIKANPRDPSLYINAGAFSLQTADADRAADYFASALAIDPSSAPARTGLSRARALRKN